MKKLILPKYQDSSPNERLYRNLLWSNQITYYKKKKSFLDYIINVIVVIFYGCYLLGAILLGMKFM